MGTRVVGGVLAIVGAALVGAGAYLPYAQSQDGDFKLRIFDTDAPHTDLFFAIEPAAVIAAAVVLGILLLVRPPLPITAGVLLGTGVQTALLFVGLIGFYAQSDFGRGFNYDVEPGAWIGVLGGAVIAAAGAVALAAAGERAPAATQPASQPGWYADPGEPSRLRYWSGAAWTEHTHPAQTSPPNAEGPA